jgi:hypothetical protein
VASAAELGKASALPPFVLGSEALGSVFDHRDAVTLGQSVDLVHVGGLSVQADRHDRACPVSDCFLDGCHVGVAGVGLDIHKHRSSSGQQHHFSGRCEGKGRQDHLIARADAQRHQADQKRIGAAGDRNAMSPTELRGKRQLHLGHLRAHDVLAMRKDGGDAPVEFLSESILLRCEVDERNVWGGDGFHCEARSVSPRPSSTRDCGASTA